MTLTHPPAARPHVADGVGASAAPAGERPAREAPELWYHPDDLRLGNAAVRVIWAGRTFIAARVKNAAGRWQWAENALGKLTFLPRPADARAWGDKPDGWQPIDARRWAEPLPPPLRSIAPRMARIGGVAFSATEAAAEMEADRDHARRNQPAPPPEPLAWWRDATLVTYSPMGSIEVREAEGRVCRALYFLGGSLHETALQVRTNADVIADMIAAEAGVDGIGGIPGLGITPADTADRLLLAMRWACEMRMDPKADGHARFLVLYLRARNVPITFRAIGDTLDPKVSPQRAQQIHAAALEAITSIANTGTPQLDQQLRSIQAGNRAHANSR